MLKPWAWLNVDFPNEQPLWEWLKEFSKECKTEICSTDENYRMELDYTGMNETLASGADFSGASLYQTQFLASDLSYAAFRKAYVEQTDFTGANLDEADFNLATVSEIDLSHASLRFSKMSSIDLSESTLSYADLYHAKLIDTNLAGSDLSHANLVGADLSATTGLDSANLTEAIYDDTTKFPDGFSTQEHALLPHRPTNRHGNP